jgi:hypothetical protein
MSEQTAEATATETAGTEEQAEQTKPTETVEFWREKAKLQEKRAKENADAAKRLSAIEEAQKSEAEKAADRIAKADAEVAAVPAKVAEALREHLVKLHGIDADDADLFLTGSEPDLLLKQVERLLGQADTRKKTNNISPREGTEPKSGSSSNIREFARNLFDADA